MIDVGPYRYTDEDAMHTIRNLGMWWELLADGIEVPRSFDDIVAEQAEVLASFYGDRVAARGINAIALLSAGAFDLIRAGADCTHVLSESLRLLSEGAAALRHAGLLGSAASGSLVQINRSGGGVPKTPVDDAVVDLGGVVGDVQSSRRHHGRPWQALCLWSAEVIDAFARDGHPIGYGSCGENFTISGIDWQRVRAGVRLMIGEALCEVSMPALPCVHNAKWFTGGDFNLMHHERGPFSRWYATVLNGGEVRPGDKVELEP
ncbi:MAG: MOSC domain-containing protein [Acidimicrobiia bacterium]